ncbi:3,4-dihydroxy-2-butanone-4-phosphate synthase [Tengunoibacter tsumagoiensis]|uniref:3,4-dihydroxy-2-butanone 4-phosphate synthase n=1 Tax=Tengunoibacter tsumagoiensis TaxID=2014871 RepID=A0A402A166_9CHLR|nr:3,4-dihydroxy-2-butanone-4-phosphate synthase [Tengunoibacter tsumagoiensis]GCE12873.1 hypothetical protein KTT_27320 [Tengunoibacter tsumagoiensis]
MTMLSSLFLSLSEALEEIQAGRMVLMSDDEERENETDLCLAAQFITPAQINFLLNSAHGLICVPLTGERLDALDIPLMESAYSPLQGTAFTISVDARAHTTTGISSSDRAQTIHTLIDPSSQASDLARPGHVFPLRAHAEGLSARRGHTEAAVALMQLAGLEPGAVICEVLDPTGEPARGTTLLEMAHYWHIGLITVETIAQAQRLLH